METSTEDHPDRWIATGNEHDVLSWVADRSAAAERHLVPVAAVGRTPTGHLVVYLDRPTGTPLVAALDRLGTPTTGVAVTLTVPLLELLVAVHDGAVLLGAAGIDDVLVDDSGAVVLCDRPTNATSPTTPTNPMTPTNPTNARTPTRTAPPTRTAHSTNATRTLVLAARTVWDRVDPTDPAQQPVLDALQDALDGDGPSARAALDVVHGTAAPRPFRWTPVPSDLVFAEPPTSDGHGHDQLLERLRDVVEHGVPLGADRRLPLCRVLVGLVVAVGSVVAALTLLGGG
ncbi:hypothetical protein [Curtobacterium flaccumfaciens]|uniref:hypothetical protein n=1 Tax=Curtobacterium flaccumfaciens TaxID=2035 RepID=UPI001366F0EF|nr:hypothetical protein [Curtobacterium flaccumfaciens]MBT1667739.1 hypothetical protein [Curtobacterium flaccumfaciens pv. flaccumfaciens]QFS80439.2 hypothetical protein GBG65_16515 [Curtobacterium flaccumfaciens pv. flaccumfaciens]